MSPSGGLSDLRRDAQNTARGMTDKTKGGHSLLGSSIQGLAHWVGACRERLVPKPKPINRALPKGVEVIHDLEYADYGDRTLRLDLYRPTARGEGLFPAVVVIRGGGFNEGDRRWFGPMAAALGVRGFAAACIEYRGSTEAPFPAAVHDTKAAVRWVRANAETYGLNPQAIGAIGGSSGAYLTLYLAVTAGQDSLEGAGGNQGISSRVGAIVCLGTPTDPSRASSATQFLGSSYPDDARLRAEVSALTHISEAAPPALLIHGGDDVRVPVQEALDIASEYESNGVPVELVVLPKAPHAFWNLTWWFTDTMDRAAAFFRRHLNDAP
jgi:acetyl esterase/lipase